VQRSPKTHCLSERACVFFLSTCVREHMKSPGARANALKAPGGLPRSEPTFELPAP
jgi:hypothetical protein